MIETGSARDLALTLEYQAMLPTDFLLSTEIFCGLRQTVLSEAVQPRRCRRSFDERF